MIFQPRIGNLKIGSVTTISLKIRHCCRAQWTENFQILQKDGREKKRDSILIDNQFFRLVTYWPQRFYYMWFHSFFVIFFLSIDKWIWWNHYILHPKDWIDILIFAFYFQEPTMKRDVWVKNETFFAKCNGVKYFRRVILLAFHSWFIIINNEKYLVNRHKNRKSFFRNYFAPLCFVTT